MGVTLNGGYANGATGTTSTNVVSNTGIQNGATGTTSTTVASNGTYDNGSPTGTSVVSTTISGPTQLEEFDYYGNSGSYGWEG